MFSLIIITWHLLDNLPCMVASVWGFLYNFSLLTAMSLFNCQALVQLSLTHQWSWIHECKNWTLRMICILVVAILISLTMGQDLHQVRSNQLQKTNYAISTRC